MSTDPDMTPSENPTDPNNPDTGGRAMPPYEGRRETADIDGPESSEKDGAKTAGATGPVEDDAMKATPKEDTSRGAGASPSDEQPGSESTDTDQDPDMVGPDHYTGTGRGEDEGA